MHMVFNIDDLVKHLTLEEKVSLISGADGWHTRAIQRPLPGAPGGIPAIRVTDGPHGVRRPYEDDNGSIPSNSFPTASAVAATWNVELVNRMAQALAVDTKALGCDILLGPAVNIHRAPLCGRNFEYYSEDPYLAGRMAVAYIQGLQSRGVGASIKHFAANNAEFERFTISSDLDERTLREIYLPAFEMAVKEADPWTVMCSYNKINGVWASENPYLLNDILKKEWGFQGFVVSDWGAVHHRIRAANAGMDLEMPGLGEMPIRIVVDAVRRGLVPESAVDESVRRILRIVFMARKEGQSPQLQPGATDTPENRALAREAAGEAIVLLKNEGGLLPIDPASVRSIAVFGPNAAVARIQGGGSAHVNPYYTVSPLEGIRRRAGDKIRVEYSQGCKNNITPPVLDSETTCLPGSNEKGFRASYFANPDFSGEPVAVRAEPALRFSMTGLPAGQLKGKAISVRWEGDFTAPVSGEFSFGLSSFGQSRLLVDGQVVTDHWTDPDLPAFMSVWPWQSKFGKVQMKEGQVYRLVVEYVSPPGRIRLSASYDAPLPADELDRVSRMAAAADLAVVCVGTTWEHETEGHDRLAWELPGEQANLTRTVLRANPRTVVVLNNGSPLDVSSWIARVPAVLEAWFNGQETGNAIADVLFGDVNPSGKLPDTYPVHYEDNPSYLNYPGESGHLTYGEGLFVGYRYYDAKNLEPLFPFGFGLSYTTFGYENLRLSAAEIDPGSPLVVSVDVRNTGARAGKEVVQLYVRDVESRLVRPPKELKGFQKVALAPGEVKTLTFTLTLRDLSFYDPTLKDWVAEPGTFEILVGSSSRDIRAVGKFTLRGEAKAPRPRLNADTHLSHILQDPRGRAVIERYLSQAVPMSELNRFADRLTLNRMSLSFMEILPPDLLATITAELAKID
jgi:beta-glucosidase